MKHNREEKPFLLLNKKINIFLFSFKRKLLSLSPVYIAVFTYIQVIFTSFIDD